MPSCNTCGLLLSCSRPQKTTFSGCAKFQEFQLPGGLSSLIEEVGGSLSPATGRVAAFGDAEEDEDREVNLLSMIDDVLEDASGSGIVPPDIRVDDRDLKEFPNFYAWSTAPKGSGVTPFARQLWIGAHLFSEVCVPCSKDKSWAKDIHKVPVDAPLRELGGRIQFLEYGRCPKCGATKVDAYRTRDLNPYQELCLVVGQRAGKSAAVSFYSAYHIHKLLKLQNPNQVYGLPASQTLAGTFVGLTFSASMQLLWMPLDTLIKNSPWFIEYHKLLGHYGKKYGEELVKHLDTILHYRHRGLLFHPAGADKRKLRGLTRILAAIDELGWWPIGGTGDDSLEKSGLEVYNALDRSLLTVRQSAVRRWKEGYVNIPTAFSLNVSSPSSWMDMIMRLYRASLSSRKMLGLQLPTWELNPELPRSAFNSEFAKDTVMAMRDYGAQPPTANNPFIAASDVIDASFSLVTSRVVVESAVKVDSTATLRQVVRLAQNYRSTGAELPPSLMAIDAGVTNNSFALVVGHLTRSSNPNELPVVTYPVLVEIIPRPNAQLSFNSIFKEVVIPVAKACNVRALLADRWNSLMLLDTAREEHGIHAEQYSVKRQDFDLAKSYLDGGKVRFPLLDTKGISGGVVQFNPDEYPQCFRGKTIDHFYMQIHTVKDSGRSVDKGTGLTDDLFRAWILAETFLRNTDFTTKHVTGALKRTSNVALGVVAGRSGGGGGGGGGEASRLGSVAGRSSR